MISTDTQTTVTQTSVRCPLPGPTTVFDDTHRQAEDEATGEMSGQADTATTAEARTPAQRCHHLVEGVARVLTKPRFRGSIHVFQPAPRWPVHHWSRCRRRSVRRAGLTTLAYTAATITMFTVSATYHR